MCSSHCHAKAAQHRWSRHSTCRLQNKTRGLDLSFSMGGSHHRASAKAAAMRSITPQHSTTSSTTSSGDGLSSKNVWTHVYTCSAAAPSSPAGNHTAPPLAHRAASTCCTAPCPSTGRRTRRNQTWAAPPQAGAGCPRPCPRPGLGWEQCVSRRSEKGGAEGGGRGGPCSSQGCHSDVA